MGRPRIALTVDSLQGGRVDRDRIAAESRLKSVLHVFRSLNRIRKPMRNTQHKALPIAHSPFYKPCEDLRGKLWVSIIQGPWYHTLHGALTPR